MNPMQEVGHLVGRELRRSVRSAKGLVLFLLCAMGAAGTAMLISASERALKDGHLDGSGAQRQFLEGFYDAAVASRLANVPGIVIWMLIGTVALAPGFVALLGFDAVSAELQFRSVRYWTVRMRRGSYFVGKVVSVFVLAALATFIAQTLGWGIAIARGVAPFGDTLSWGLVLWLTILPILLAWCALSVFLSSLVRTPILALLFNFGANFLLWMCWLVGKLAEQPWVRFVYPNHVDSYLLSPASDRVAIGLVTTIVFAALFTVAGTFVFQQRDL